MKTILIVTLIILCASASAQFGENTDYKLISLEDYVDKQSRGRLNPMKRYLVVPKLFNKRDSFDNLHTGDPETILGSCISLIDYGREEDVQEFLDKEKIEVDLANLVKGCRYFASSDYAKALELFNSCSGEQHAFLYQLLKADCCYQIEKANESQDWQMVFRAYQHAYDLAIDSYQKELVKNRIKLTRYLP